MVKALAFASAVALLLPAHGRAQTDTLTTMLERASRYVEEFFVGLTNVVADERYEQKSTFRSALLLSEFLFVKGQDGWQQYRAVVSVNGTPVRDDPGAAHAAADGRVVLVGAQGP